MAASDVDFVLVEERALLREVFPLLDEGVEAITARCPDEVVTGADLYAAAITGDVEIRLVRYAGETVGFMATHANRLFTGGFVLSVWMLYLLPGTPDCMDEVVAELEFMAGTQGCSAIEFHTTRPAWERRLAPYGFTPHCIQFRKEVSHVQGR